MLATPGTLRPFPRGLNRDFQEALAAATKQVPLAARLALSRSFAPAHAQPSPRVCAETHPQPRPEAGRFR